MAIFKLVSFFAPLTVCAELASTPWPLIAELDTENFDRHIGVEKRYTWVQFRGAYCVAKSCDKRRQVMEEVSVRIGSLDSLDGNVPDITFAEIDISADHPARLRFAERFGIRTLPATKIFYSGRLIQDYNGRTSIAQIIGQFHTILSGGLEWFKSPNTKNSSAWLHQLLVKSGTSKSKAERNRAATGREIAGATKPVHGHFLLSIGSHSQSASSTPAPSKHSQSASSTPAPSKQEEPTAARKAPTDAKHRNSDVASLSTHLRGLGERVKAQQRTMRQMIQSLKEFAQWQENQVQMLLDGENPRANFIVFQELPGGDFGSHVEGLLSALVYAVAAERIFVVDFKSPTFTSLFQPLPIQCDIGLFKGFFQQLGDSQLLQLLQRPRTGVSKRFPTRGCLRPSLDWVCEDQMLVSPQRVIVFRGNSWSGNLLFYNHNYEERLRRLFGPRTLSNNFFAAAYRWAIRPKVVVQKLIEEMHRSTAGERLWVGLQLRGEQSPGTGSACARKWQAQSSVLTDEALMDLSEAAVRAGVGSRKIPIFYVAAQAHAEAARVLGAKNVVWSGNLTGLEHNYPALPKGDLRRALDLLALQSCHDIIVTGKGGALARLAYAGANIIPRVATASDGKTGCVRAASAKPCPGASRDILEGSSCLEPRAALFEEIHLECERAGGSNTNPT